jgi:D-sedoheptulose 7-phosphate isomerase
MSTNHSDPTKPIDLVRQFFLDSADLQKLTSESCAESIVSAVNSIVESLSSGKKILLCGNGGSAADCQHMATELVSQMDPSSPRRGLPAIAFITAYSNDFNFDGIFERQVEALGFEGDILIAISTSGSSTNIIKAVKAAQKKSMKTIALTGQLGDLKKIADISISIPSKDTQKIQQSHLVAEHIICLLVESNMFGSLGGKK